jgi:hypothetical protein
MTTVLSQPLPANDPAALTEAVAKPQGAAFVEGIRDPRDGRT